MTKNTAQNVAVRTLRKMVDGTVCRDIYAYSAPHHFNLRVEANDAREQQRARGTNTSSIVVQ